GEVPARKKKLEIQPPAEPHDHGVRNITEGAGIAVGQQLPVLVHRVNSVLPGNVGTGKQKLEIQPPAEPDHHWVRNIAGTSAVTIGQQFAGDERRRIDARALHITPLNYALVRIQPDIGGDNWINEEGKTGRRSCVGSSSQKDAVLIKQTKERDVAVTRAGVAHLWVLEIRQWIDDHLSNLVAENVGIDLIVRSTIDGVIVISDS